MDDRNDRNLLVYSLSKNVLLENSYKNDNELLKLQTNNFQGDINRLNETNNLHVI